MPSQAISGYGTLLKRGDGGAPETFTTVPEVGTITGPSMEWDEEDVTTHSSAASGRAREHILTIFDTGTVEFPMNYVATDPIHVAMRQDFLNGLKRNWQLVLPGGIQTISFAASVKSMPFEFGVDAAIRQNLVLRCTGAPTFA